MNGILRISLGNLIFRRLRRIRAAAKLHRYRIIRLSERRIAREERSHANGRNAQNVAWLHVLSHNHYDHNASFPATCLLCAHEWFPPLVTSFRVRRISSNRVSEHASGNLFDVTRELRESSEEYHDYFNVFRLCCLRKMCRNYAINVLSISFCMYYLKYM